MDSLKPPCERFKDNTICLAELCRTIVADAYKQGLTTIMPGYITIGMDLIEKTHSKNNRELINTFIINSHPHWDKILTHNEDFFDKHSESIFNSWEKEHRAMFRDLVFLKKPDGSLFITPKQKEQTWILFESLVKISLHHIHETRQGKKTSDGKIIYQHPEIFPEIKQDMLTLTKTWKIYDRLRFN